jgi:hypothetical protein
LPLGRSPLRNSPQTYSRVSAINVSIGWYFGAWQE